MRRCPNCKEECTQVSTNAYQCAGCGKVWDATFPTDPSAYITFPGSGIVIGLIGPFKKGPVR